MASNKLSGNVIGVEIEGKFISCETSCEISFDTDMIPASAVDDGGWKSFLPGANGWTMALNAFMLINSAVSNQDTILNAFIFKKRIGVRFASKFTGISDFELKGYAYVKSGGITATVNTKVGYNTILQGDGPLNPDEPASTSARFGFRLADPYGDEGSLVPQFSKTIDPTSLSIPFDFTKPSAANFLFIIVPHGTTVFNKWENNDINFGDIPDFVFREMYTIGDDDYYVTRELVYFTSSTSVVTLKKRSVTPNAYTFSDIVAALRNTEYISNEVTIEGISEPVPISLAGGIGYSINGGAYTNLDGLIGNGDKVRVKLLTSAAYNTMVSAVLTVGGVSDSYDVATQLDAALFYAYASGAFFKQGCISPETGSSVPFTRTYTGANQPAADAAKAADAAQFVLDGQANANATGTCLPPPIYLWGQIIEEEPETIGASTYARIIIWFYEGVSDSVAPDPIVPNRIESPLSNITLQYRQEGTTPAAPVNFGTDVYGVTGKVLAAPGSSYGNPVYPKQLVELSDGTYFYFAAPGKAENEVFYIGSY